MCQHTSEELSTAKKRRCTKKLVKKADGSKKGKTEDVVAESAQVKPECCDKWVRCPKYYRHRAGDSETGGP